MRFNIDVEKVDTEKDVAFDGFAKPGGEYHYQFSINENLQAGGYATSPKKLVKEIKDFFEDFYEIKDW